MKNCGRRSPAQKNQSHANAALPSEKEQRKMSDSLFADKRLSTLQYQELQDTANKSFQVHQLKEISNQIHGKKNSQEIENLNEVIQIKQNQTGLPGGLKQGVESLSEKKTHKTASSAVQKGVVQRMQVVLTYKNDVSAARIDTKNLTKSQLMNLLKHSRLSEQSKKEIRAALSKKDYKDAHQVQEEPKKRQRLPKPEKSDNQSNSGSSSSSASKSGSQSNFEPSHVSPRKRDIKKKQKQQSSSDFDFGSGSEFNFDFGSSTEFGFGSGFDFGTSTSSSSPKREIKKKQKQKPELFSSQSQPKEKILASALKEAQRKLNGFLEAKPGNKKIKQLLQFVSQRKKYLIQNIDKKGVIALAQRRWGKIQIFDAFFETSVTNQKKADTIIHEASHVVFGIDDYSYKWNRIFKYLTPGEHQNNPDSIVTNINSAVKEPSQEKPPETTIDNPKNSQNAVASRVADKAFAVLGEILYHLTEPSNKQIQAALRLLLKPEEQKNFLAYEIKVATSLKLLFFLKDHFRQANIHISIGSKWKFTQVDPKNVKITLRQSTFNYLESVTSGSPEKTLSWLVLQLTKNVRVAKLIVKIILGKFNEERGGADFHLQGAYPAAIKLDPEKV